MYFINTTYFRYLKVQISTTYFSDHDIKSYMIIYHNVIFFFLKKKKKTFYLQGAKSQGIQYYIIEKGKPKAKK